MEKTTDIGAVRPRLVASVAALACLAWTGTALASEADLVLPDFASVEFFGASGRTILSLGIFVCLAGLAFGFVMSRGLKNLDRKSVV